jgi:hypothetical protein
MMMVYGFPISLDSNVMFGNFIYHLFHQEDDKG